MVVVKVRMVSLLILHGNNSDINDLKPKPYVTLTILAMASKMYYMFWQIVYYVIGRIVLDIVIVKTKHQTFL